MTKIDGRSKKEAARQLDESLCRLRVDMIDLVQHHEVLRYEDPHRIFDDDGPTLRSLRPGKRGNSAIWFYGAQGPEYSSAYAQSGFGARFRF